MKPSEPSLPARHTLLVPDRVFDGQEFLEGHAVLLDGGRIAAVEPISAFSGMQDREVLDGGLLAPGFIDVQVNGGGGRMFADCDRAAEVAAIAMTHRRQGTTSVVATRERITIHLP